MTKTRSPTDIRTPRFPDIGNPTFGDTSKQLLLNSVDWQCLQVCETKHNTQGLSADIGLQTVGYKKISCLTTKPDHCLEFE